jgi:hypothetical protein
MRVGASNKPCTHKPVEETRAQETNSRAVYKMIPSNLGPLWPLCGAISLESRQRDRRATGGVVPVCSREGRGLMVVSRVKRPASAGLLSRRGEYLLWQHEGLGSDDTRTDSAWHGRHQRRPCTVGTMTRSPPQPLFQRRAHLPVSRPRLRYHFTHALSNMVPLLNRDFGQSDSWRCFK